jgi:predicted O-methyltransferase YrrM
MQIEQKLENHQSLLNQYRENLEKSRLLFQTHYFSLCKSAINAVEGWLALDRAELLFTKASSLPDNAVIVEAGSYKGRSTVAMGYACRGTNRHIYSVDLWNPYPIEDWRHNIEKNGLIEYVTPFQGSSHEILSQWNQLTGAKLIDFIFIDASHEYADVLLDFELSFPLVKSGGWIAFHDVGDSDVSGLGRVWREKAKPLLLNCHQVGCLTFGQKPRL